MLEQDMVNLVTTAKNTKLFTRLNFVTVTILAIKKPKNKEDMM
jgi:hypothetical protein